MQRNTQLSHPLDVNVELLQHHSRILKRSCRNCADVVDEIMRNQIGRAANPVDFLNAGVIVTRTWPHTLATDQEGTIRARGNPILVREQSRRDGVRQRRVAFFQLLGAVLNLGELCANASRHPGTVENGEILVGGRLPGCVIGEKAHVGFRHPDTGETARRSVNQPEVEAVLDIHAAYPSNNPTAIGESQALLNQGTVG